MQKKFDYSYSAQELQQWNDRYLVSLRLQAEKGVVFFNNHVRAKAPANAVLLRELLWRE